MKAMTPRERYTAAAKHQPVDRLQSDIPPENMIAMRDAVHLYGRN